MSEAMSVSVSRLGPDDLERARANCEMFWDMSRAPKNLPEFLADPDCILLVAEVDGEPAGQIIGYILKRWDSKKPMLFLYSIDVVEHYRRKGVASKLIEEFRGIGGRSGCGTTFVFTSESNAPAMSLYKALGGTRINPDDVMFEWE
jgi:ribosomal protein S18 acetylase RimI-like enzyme